MWFMHMLPFIPIAGTADMKLQSFHWTFVTRSRRAHRSGGFRLFRSRG